MLSDGIQASFSSNWKPGLVPSNRAHSISEIRKVATEVISAALRQLRSTASFGPLTTRQNSAPTSGMNVTSDRIGQLDIVLPRPAEVGHGRHDADQHGEGVVVEIAALEAAQHPRDIARARGDAIRTEPVNHRAVALLPEHAADRQCRLD